MWTFPHMVNLGRIISRIWWPNPLSQLWGSNGRGESSNKSRGSWSRTKASNSGPVERAAVEPAAEWVANKAEAKITETRAAARAVPIAEQLYIQFFQSVQSKLVQLYILLIQSILLLMSLKQQSIERKMLLFILLTKKGQHRSEQHHQRQQRKLGHQE